MALTRTTAWTVCLLVLVSGCGPTGKTPTRFSVGYGQADVSPPEGTVLGGFGLPGGTRRSTGLNDPLLVQVVVVTNDAGGALVIVGLDAAGYMWDLGDWGPGVEAMQRRLVDALDDHLSIDPDQILLTSSHSHAATDLVGFWQKPGQGPALGLLDDLEVGLIAAARDAVDDLRAAELVFGRTELPDYIGRDSGCSEILDASVGVIQARTPSGDVIASLVSYGKHPTMLKEPNTIASADFIWGLRGVMRERTGAPAVFLQGPIAAVHDGPVAVPGEDGFERAWNMGALLAEAALEALETAEPADRFAIIHRRDTFTCRCEGEYVLMANEYFDLPKRHYHLEGEVFMVDAMPVSWHQLGPAEFAGVPGEPDAEYALALKDRMASPHRFVVAQADDAMGYFIDPAAVAADASGQLTGYELKMGLGPPGGPCMWRAHQDLGWFDGRALR